MSVSHTSRSPWGRGVITGACTVLALAGCGTASRSDHQATNPSPALALPLAPPLAPDLEPTPVPSEINPAPQSHMAAISKHPAAPDTLSIHVNQAVPLASVLARIRARHPSAAAAQAAVSAAEANVLQTSAWANPEVELTARRVQGRGANSGSSSTPMEFKITQPLGTYGDRSARTAAARAGVTMVEAETEAALRDLDRAAAQALLRLLAEREALILADAHLEIAQRIVNTSERLAQAGEISQGNVARARAAFAQAQASRDVQFSMQNIAQDQVAILLGEDLPQTVEISGLWVENDLNSDPAGTFTNHPAMRAVNARMEAAVQMLNAERAGRWPEWSIGVEAVRGDDADEIGLTLGFTVPVWNRNAGGIAAAQAARLQANGDAATLHLRLVQDTAETRARLAQSLAEQQALSTQVVPAAQEALRLQQIEFEAGVTALPAVLDSQRAIIDAKAQLLASRRRSAEAVMDLRVLLDGFSAAARP